MSEEPHLDQHQPTKERIGERLLPAATWRRRLIPVPGHGSVSLIEGGEGPPLVLLHGTGSPGPFFAPLLRRLDGVRALVPDRPGHGLTEPAPVGSGGARRDAVRWVGALLDALGLDRASLLGHSMGGLWALWFALAHPGRVDRLVLVGPPALPGTTTPLPYRVMATPGLWALVRLLDRPSPASVRRFATAMGEGDAIREHPDLVELLVAEGRDTAAAAADTAEGRTIVSPLALVTPNGFRRRARVRPDELRGLRTETLLVWGRDEPLGGPQVATDVVDLMPRGRSAVVPGGHAPWLDDPALVARTVGTFLQEQHHDAADARGTRGQRGARTTRPPRA